MGDDGAGSGGIGIGAYDVVVVVVVTTLQNTIKYVSVGQEQLEGVCATHVVVFTEGER